MKFYTQNASSLLICTHRHTRTSRSLVTMVSIIHRQRFPSLTPSFSHILSPSPRQALLHGQKGCHGQEGLLLPSCFAVGSRKKPDIVSKQQSGQQYRGKQTDSERGGRTQGVMASVAFRTHSSSFALGKSCLTLLVFNQDCVRKA